MCHAPALALLPRLLRDRRLLLTVPRQHVLLLRDRRERQKAHAKARRGPAQWITSANPWTHAFENVERPPLGLFAKVLSEAELIAELRRQIGQAHAPVDQVGAVRSIGASQISCMICMAVRGPPSPGGIGPNLGGVRVSRSTALLTKSAAKATSLHREAGPRVYFDPVEKGWHTHAYACTYASKACL